MMARDMSLRETLRAVLLRLALADPDPVERAAKIAILKKDGWLDHA